MEFINKETCHYYEKKLKPCPFCGCKDILLTSSYPIPNVVCTNCNGSMRGYGDLRTTVKQWNKRFKFLTLWETIKLFYF